VQAVKYFSRFLISEYLVKYPAYRIFVDFGGVVLVQPDRSVEKGNKLG
jgi:hypothetical protein